MFQWERRGLEEVSKNKIVSLLNESPRHEGVLGSGRRH
jgi:hypothetical protein